MSRDPAAALATAAPVFAALGDAQRLRLVARLCHDGPLSVVRLTESTDVSRQAVAKHLRVLAAAGLARSRRSGRETVWKLDLRRLREANAHLATISRQWDEALARLRDLVETP